MKNQNNEILIGRRDFLKGTAALAAYMVATGLMPKVEAATKVSDEELYQSFVNAFADNVVSQSENVYGIQVDMGNVESFTMADSQGNHFILNHYVNSIKNKTQSNWYTYFDKAAANTTDDTLKAHITEQARFLQNCEIRLNSIANDPNNIDVAREFLNDVKDRMLLTKNSTPDGDYADFDGHYYYDTALYETVCEMVYAAWYKTNIYSINYLRQQKPAAMGTDAEYWCAQNIIDKTCGRTDTSDRNVNERKSGFTKGNVQTELLISLNAYAPSRSVQKMVIRKLYGIIPDEILAGVLGIDTTTFNSIVSEAVKEGTLVATNGIEETNGMSRKLTR